MFIGKPNSNKSSYSRNERSINCFVKKLWVLRAIFLLCCFYSLHKGLCGEVNCIVCGFKSISKIYFFVWPWTVADLMASSRWTAISPSDQTQFWGSMKWYVFLCFLFFVLLFVCLLFVLCLIGMPWTSLDCYTEWLWCVGLFRRRSMAMWFILCLCLCGDVCLWCLSVSVASLVVGWTNLELGKRERDR